MIPDELTISIVTYYPNITEFTQTLKCLKSAIDFALREHSVVVQVVVVDNSADQTIATNILELLELYLHGNTEFIRSPSNLGYGMGHNFATLNRESQWYLVMNADVLLEVTALSESLNFLKGSEHSSIGLISPHCMTGDGQRAYLCKRYPSVFNLALRGFAPASLKQLFNRRLAHYEYRHETEQQLIGSVTIVSGCFMFLRGEMLRNIGGFSPEYFLYFEDFDLCMRLHQICDIAYVPKVRIIHHGGHAARKGLTHIYLFIRSAFGFFSTHGWRIV